MIVCLIALSIILTVACLTIRTELDKISNNKAIVFLFPASINYLIIKILDSIFHKIARFF